jgi:DNA-3-methyladenine glycosylase
MKPVKLKRAFYQRDTLLVARELLGMRLVRRSKDGTTSGIIVETEAYIGFNDKASHASRGMTGRNEVMFGTGGYSYIYFIYGIYYCFNIVTEKAGYPAAVLVRALEPLEGIGLMAERRGIKEVTPKNIVTLTNGPSKLCRALSIDKALNGADLCGDELYIAVPEDPRSFTIISTPRIGIHYAGEAVDYPWRFIVEGNRFVSNTRMGK